MAKWELNEEPDSGPMWDGAPDEADLELEGINPEPVYATHGNGGPKTLFVYYSKTHTIVTDDAWFMSRFMVCEGRVPADEIVKDYNAGCPLT